MPAEPTEIELSILQILWQNGPSTVRQVHESLRGGAGTRYTTTLKQLQVMAEKGLVDRDESARSHVYRAAVEEALIKRSLLGGVIDRVFGGSVRKMVVHALESRSIDADELNEIKRLLAESESSSTQPARPPDDARSGTG